MRVDRRILATVAVAAGLGWSFDAAAAPTRIEFFFPVPVEGQLAKEMTNMVKRFNTAQSEVEAVAVYTGSYDDTKIKMQAAIAAGRPPGVVLTSANFVLEYKLNDQIAPLEPLLAADGTDRVKFLEDFWPALHANATVDGKLYAIPFQNSTPLVYYNADLLKEAGFDHAPVDWAELIAMATKLTKKTGGNTEVWGLMMPQTYDYCGWLFSAFTMLNGGQYFNPVYGGEVYYDAPSTLGAMRLYDDAVHKYGFLPGSVTDAKEVSSSFFAGKAAMVIMSTGSLSFVRDNAKFKYGVAFLPRNVRNAAPIGGGSLVMPKDLPDGQRKAAWSFMTWLSAPEQLASWSRFTGYFAPRKSAYELPEMKQFTAEHPEALIALQQLLKFGQPWFATFNTVGVRQAMEDQVQAVLTGKKKPEQAVKDAQRAADEIMKPYVDSTAAALIHGG
jgi:sn-glycerol 3-phosphate transport system substrate-binding protein